MSNAGKSIGGGANAQHGAKGAGSAAPETLDEFDLASDIKGKNSLHGEDQLRHRNQRQEQAGATGDTDSLMESFEKLDDETRAARDGEKQPQHPDKAAGRPFGRRRFAAGQGVRQMGVSETEQAVRARAYELWEREGRPEGRELDHWAEAERELGAGPSDLDRDPGIGSSRGAWKADPENDPTEGGSTFEGDVMNDTTRTGSIDPQQRGRTNP